MPDPTLDPVVDPLVEPVAGVKPTEPPPNGDDPLSALSPEAQKIFKETQAGMLSALNKEREANKEATGKLAAMEKESQSRLEKQLKEQGKFKELAEERALQLAEVQPKVDLLEAAQATLKKVLEAQIEQIPESKRTLVPGKLSTEDQLEWIAANQALLSKAAPIDIGAGKQGGTGQQSVELTNEEMDAAKHLGMKPEDYAKFKD